MKNLLIILMALLPYIAMAEPANCCDDTRPQITLASSDDATKSEAQKKLIAGLTGKWQNTTYPFDLVALDGNPNERLEGAILSFEFRADGSYTKTLGSASYRVVENGSWEVSSDARQLLMYPEGSNKAEIATVKYYEYDEMVIEHALKCTHKPYCTGVKDFFFNKF